MSPLIQIFNTSWTFTWQPNISILQQLTALWREETGQTPLDEWMNKCLWSNRFQSHWGETFNIWWEPAGQSLMGKPPSRARLELDTIWCDPYLSLHISSSLPLLTALLFLTSLCLFIGWQFCGHFVWRQVGVVDWVGQFYKTAKTNWSLPSFKESWCECVLVSDIKMNDSIIQWQDFSVLSWAGRSTWSTY